MHHYLAIDVGGSSIKYGIIQENGTLVSQGQTSLPRSFETFSDHIDQIVEESLRTMKFQGIAFSVPGAVDSEHGVIHGKSAVPYIHNRPFLEAFRSRYGLPVSVINDANAAALAEGWNGAASDLKRYATVVIGSGIGGAIVDDGNVVVGSHLHGGEFGYWILDPSVPNFAGTWSFLGATRILVSRCSARLNRPLDGQDIFNLQHDPRINEELETFFRWNAIGIYNIQFSIDPERILIGGGISRRPEIRPGIERHLQLICEANETIPVQIGTCAHFNEANLIGAVRHFLSNVGF